MLISKLSWDLWGQNHDRGQVVDVTDWHSIQQAIDALDGVHRTLVTLEASGETHMAIGGGPSQYTVYVTFDNEEFHYLVDRSKSRDDILQLVVGGQLGDYPAHWCVEKSIVLQAAQEFAESLQLATSVKWERDEVLEFA